MIKDIILEDSRFNNILAYHNEVADRFGALFGKLEAFSIIIRQIELVIDCGLRRRRVRVAKLEENFFQQCDLYGITRLRNLKGVELVLASNNEGTHQSPMFSFCLPDAPELFRIIMEASLAIEGASCPITYLRPFTSSELTCIHTKLDTYNLEMDFFISSIINLLKDNHNDETTNKP